MSTSLPEEYDPKTGTFRPIASPARSFGANSSSEIASGRRPEKPTRPVAGGLSESGQKFGVFYEIFEHAARTKTAKRIETGTKVVILVIFGLLMYEAISYRLALG